MSVRSELEGRIDDLLAQVKGLAGCVIEFVAQRDAALAETKRIDLVRMALQDENASFYDLARELEATKLQNQEMLAVLIALADRVSVRFGEIIKYEPVATGRYLDAAYEVIGKAKTEKRKCPVCGGDLPDSCYAKEVNDEPVR